MAFEPYAARTQEKMKDVLMSPDAQGPAVHYYMIRGGSKKRNITVLETGTVGGEYIKTYGHYHVFDFGPVSEIQRDGMGQRYRGHYFTGRFHYPGSV